MKKSSLPATSLQAACTSLAAIAVLLFFLDGSTSGAMPDKDSPDSMRIRTKDSLLHLGSIDSFDITPGGVDAARALLRAIEDDRPGVAREALRIYARIIPTENFGGEYTALQWFCHYLLACETDRAKMLEDDLAASYFHFFADNDFATLREYLKRKYKLAKFDDEDSHKARRRLGFLEDFILFNNPVRERWEKSSKMVAALGLKPGQVVADIGCGPGYFSFKFARLVGPQGRVYAIDTNELHTEYVSGLCKKLGVENIQTVKGDFHDIKVDAEVDCAFLCSLYHVIYATSSESEKDALIASIKRVLKKDATLVIVDNALVHDETLPYHGPYIDHRLIVGQLRHYGFRLVATHQLIPQRYMLVFKLDPHAPSRSDAPVASAAGRLTITSSASLIHIPNDGLPDVTEGGRQAAKFFLAALESRDEQAARAAVDRYRELIPREKFGDEYTAFQWFC
jgi:ubiquinone/menaquinone biosynthesis C-methylase UbiE